MTTVLGGRFDVETCRSAAPLASAFGAQPKWTHILMAGFQSLMAAKP